MSLGMSMLFESMGLDAEKLQANVNNAIAHVQQINERIGRVETTLTMLAETQKLIGQSCIDNAAVNVRVDAGVSSIQATQNQHSETLGSMLGDLHTNYAATLRIEDAVEMLRIGGQPNSKGFLEEYEKTTPIEQVVDAVINNNLAPFGVQENAGTSNTTNSGTSDTTSD